MTGAALAAKRWDATEPSSVAFVTATAEKFGLTDRQVRKIVAAGSRLGPDEVAQLRAAPRQVTLKDLTEIAKIGAPTERYDEAMATDRDILIAAGRALGRIDRDGVRAITRISVDEVEAIALALVILGLKAIPPQQLVPPDELVITRKF